MKQVTLARITGDRRRRQRRSEDAPEILATLQVFEHWERVVLKQIDRRRTVRRGVDVRHRVARLET